MNRRMIPIDQALQYRVLYKGAEQVDGVGTSVEMSSTEVRFKTSTPPSRGNLLELSVNWPVALNGSCPLKLVVNGHVASVADETVVVRICSYNFRTRGRSAPGAARNDAENQQAAR